MRATLDGYMESWGVCIAAFPSCDVSVLAEHRYGALLEAAGKVVRKNNERGVTVEDVDARTLEIESIEVDGNSARAITCGVDRTTWYVPDGNGGRVLDGDDGDEVTSARTRLTLRKSTDGDWRIGSNQVLESGVGEEDNVCADQ